MRKGRDVALGKFDKVEVELVLQQLLLAIRRLRDANLPMPVTDERGILPALNLLIDRASSFKRYFLPEVKGAGWGLSEALNVLADLQDRMTAMEGQIPVRATMKPVCELLPDAGNNGFYAQITGNTVADSPAQNRWTYSWKRVVKDGDGYDGWSDSPTGRSGSDNAFNIIEDMNQNIDIGGVPEGTGVDPYNLDTVEYTFAIQPCPTNCIVWLQPVSRSSGACEFWFCYENGLDGACD